MKKVLAVTIGVLAMLSLASTAQAGGGEASGTFTFDLGTAAGSTSLFGQLRNDGSVNGQISFSAAVDSSGEACAQVIVGYTDGEQPIYANVCEPTGNDPDNGVTMFRENVPLNFLIDCMVISGTRAAMSGTIVDESSAFNGLHTILAVESTSNNDGFTWGVYPTKHVNTNAKDYDLCPYDPSLTMTTDGCGDGCVIGDQPASCFATQDQTGAYVAPNNPDTGATLTYAASDYELCPYPPDELLGTVVPADPHNYPCFNGNTNPDPNGRPAGIPVDALPANTITKCSSFPLFSYPMTPIPHGGGNKVTVKNNS
jgi:hypothetical protein